VGRKGIVKVRVVENYSSLIPVRHDPSFVRENLSEYGTSKSRALPTKYHQCFLMPANSNVSPIAKKIIHNSYERKHYHKKSQKYKNIT